MRMLGTALGLFVAVHHERGNRCLTFLSFSTIVNPLSAASPRTIFPPNRNSTIVKIRCMCNIYMSFCLLHQC